MVATSGHHHPHLWVFTAEIITNTSMRDDVTYNSPHVVKSHYGVKGQALNKWTWHISKASNFCT